MKRPHLTSKLRGFFFPLILLFLGVWVATPAWSQISTTIGSIVKGFSIPQHNESGELVSKIAGTEANTVSPNRAVIKELVMEFYNQGVVSMKVTSPQSDYWFLQSRLNTREGVTIERENMIITAQMFQWEEKEKKGVLQKNVSVVLKNFNLSTPVVAPTSSTPSSIPGESLQSKPTDAPLRLELNNSAPSQP